MSEDKQEFLDLAEDFERVSPNKVEEILAKDGEAIVLVARETCPYCRKFMPKIHKVATENNRTIYFIHSHDKEYKDEIDAFRSKYGMPTVPSLLYKNDEGTHSVSDSSLSEEEIAEFIHIQ